MRSNILTTRTLSLIAPVTLWSAALACGTSSPPVQPSPVANVIPTDTPVSPTPTPIPTESPATPEPTAEPEFEATLEGEALAQYEPAVGGT